MANPIFSKTGVTSVTLSKSNLYPNVQPLVLNQFVGISDANTVRVASIGDPLRTIVLVFEQLTRTDRDALEAFFADPLVNYGEFSFTFTDASSTVYVVQFLEPALALPEVTDNNVKFEMILTIVG